MSDDDSNVVALGPTVDELIRGMRGARLCQYRVIVDGRQIPRLTMQEVGDSVEFVLDDRFGFTFPRECAMDAAAFAAQALAIGAGYPSLGAQTKDRPFAPEVFRLDASVLRDEPA